jgi:hypothetical protein
MAADEGDAHKQREHQVDSGDDADGPEGREVGDDPSKPATATAQMLSPANAIMRAAQAVRMVSGDIGPPSVAGIRRSR